MGFGLAPLKYNRLGIGHINTLQEIKRLQMIISHTVTNIFTWLLYRASIENLVVETGMGQDVLNMPFQEVGGLTSKALIKSTWKFINKHGITLQHDVKTWSFREDDAPIMRVFFQNNLLQEHLISINKCHIYMKLYFLSGLVTYDNRLKQFLTTRTASPLINQFEWPQKGKPSNKD